MVDKTDGKRKDLITEINGAVHIENVEFLVGKHGGIWIFELHNAASLYLNFAISIAHS